MIGSVNQIRGIQTSSDIMENSDSDESVTSGFPRCLCKNVVVDFKGMLPLKRNAESPPLPVAHMKWCPKCQRRRKIVVEGHVKGVYP